MSKAIKILRLALCPSAQEGEWRAAAVKFVEILRNDPGFASTFLRGDAGPKAAPAPRDDADDFKGWQQPKRKPTRTPCGTYTAAEKEAAEKLQFHFGKHKGTEIKSVPPDYLVWVLENVAKLSPKTRRKIEIVLDSRRKTSSPR